MFRDQGRWLKTRDWISLVEFTRKSVPGQNVRLTTGTTKIKSVFNAGCGGNDCQVWGDKPQKRLMSDHWTLTIIFLRLVLPYLIIHVQRHPPGAILAKRKLFNCNEIRQKIRMRFLKCKEMWVEVDDTIQVLVNIIRVDSEHRFVKWVLKKNLSYDVLRRPFLSAEVKRSMHEVIN